MDSFAEMTAADFAGVINQTDGPAVEITYTPATGDAVTCNAMVGPEDVDLFDAEGNQLAARARQVVVAKADVATVAIGDQVAIGSRTYGVRDVDVDSDLLAVLLCVDQQRQQIGDPDRHLHGD